MRKKAGAALLGVLVATSFFACVEAPQPASPNQPHEKLGTTTGAPEAPPAEQEIAGAKPPPLLFLRERSVLAELETRGLDFRSLLGSSTTTPLPKEIGNVLSSDIRELKEKDPSLGVAIARHSHRLVPLEYLTGTATRTRLELTAIANRLDRGVFSTGSCGEVRLLYRLVYGSAEAEPPSRFPATLIAEFELPKAAEGVSCDAIAKSWQLDASLAPNELANALVSESGPLRPEFLSRKRLKQLGLNLQVVRFPSAIKPDLGGHAEYLLRSFRWDEERQQYREGSLENTPDLNRLKSDAALRRDLVEVLANPESLERIARGTFLLPERFLAKKAFSVSPRGLARSSNRPFTSLLEEQLPKALVLPAPIASSRALLRRLDQMSCQGCHQTRSVAGFHFLGDEQETASAGAAIAVALSPHLSRELERRKDFLSALLEGRDLPPLGFADGGRADSDFGEPCGLGDPTYTEWTCAPGLRCVALDLPLDDATQVGQCLPENPEVGDACEAGTMHSGGESRRDVLRVGTPRNCAENQVCNRTSVGFPGGMCTAACDDASPHVRCGPIAILEPFNACLARGQPFAICLTKHTQASGLRSCDSAHACRDDYACAKIGEGAGACVPPYFLLQLRVDGHP